MGTIDISLMIGTFQAGYTPVMLAALCDVNDEVEAAVIHRLFQMGNVNEQAVQVVYYCCHASIHYVKWLSAGLQVTKF